MNESLIERLRIHANDERNTAFSRSTMREVLEVLADGGKDSSDAVHVRSYCISHNSDVAIDRVRQIKGEDLWAVRRSGGCLNKDGEWEYEPMPSSRDDEFLARCRFATAREAIDAAIAKEKK
jgi:hypothetical protein